MTKRIILAFSCCLCVCVKDMRAQVIITDAYNYGGQAYDFSNAETVTTHPTTGVGYVSRNGGVYYHFGPATATLTVSGYYNAFDPVNPPATGIPSGWATTTNPGVDYFQGLGGAKATAQEIAGSVAPRFGILKLDNGNNLINITNTNGVEVGYRTDFTNGITTTVRTIHTAGALRFLDDATYTNSGFGNNQYVNGYVTKIGNDAFTFPVGNQGGNEARPLSISAPSIASNALSIAYWQGDAGTGLDPTGGAHPLSQLNTTPLNGEVLISVSSMGFWDWIPVSGTSNMTISVSLPAQTGIGSYSDASGIRLVGWNTTNSQWELLGNSGASGLSAGSSLSGTTNAYAGRTMASYSAIGWGSIAQMALPIKLLSFEVSTDHCNALITWETSSEYNSSYFEIEHSTDLRNYTAIGHVASENAIGGARYKFTYPDIEEGFHYFRLKSVDFDNAYSYSKIIKVRSECNDEKILLSPNPVQDALTITGLQSVATIRIFDATGRQMRQISNSGSTVTINVGAFPSGTYLVQVVGRNGKIKAAKLIIRNK
ncbi:MAG: T9SS type A sorting domain-containing protein [Agriterribacter sp.]